MIKIVCPLPNDIGLVGFTCKLNGKYSVTILLIKKKYSVTVPADVSFVKF